VADTVFVLGFELTERLLRANRHEHRVIAEPAITAEAARQVFVNPAIKVSTWPSLGQAIASEQAKWAAAAASGSVASTSRQTLSIARSQSRFPPHPPAQRAEKMPGRPCKASTQSPLSSASAAKPLRSALPGP
jgi:hypothetical protein